MTLIELGGWMMWPLLLVSVLALAIVVERGLALAGCTVGGKKYDQLLLAAESSGKLDEVAAQLARYEPFADFANILVERPQQRLEPRLRLAGEVAVARLEKHLSLLAMLARLAPLMGLLGTIFGMIRTFSSIAESSAAVDMGLLSGGIWQALITTAAGLIIAIPVMFCHSVFQGRAEQGAQSLARAGNLAIALAREEGDA